jgi:menaquinone-dependent protoporphyrinogen oxidase
MKKVLVTYATRTGYTIGIAQKIGETLAERGFLVDVKPVHADPDPANYQAVVIGSAVNGAKWLPEAVEYVKRHQQALHKPQVALFCVHILNLGDSAASQKNRKAYLNVVRPLVSASSEGYFAGKGLDPKETSAVVRWIMRVTKFMPEGDCRDWLKIAAWAQSFDLDNL